MFIQRKNKKGSFRNEKQRTKKPCQENRLE